MFRDLFAGANGAKKVNSLKCEPVPIHQHRGIRCTDPIPAQAWHENEVGSLAEYPSKEEEAALLYRKASQVSKYKSTTSNIRSTSVLDKIRTTIKKLVKAIKLPVFVISMQIILVFVFNVLPKEKHGLLEWQPGAWWRQPWRLLTYGVVHASKGHLYLNCVVALFVGWRLEYEQGWWRVMAIWFGGVAAGALGAGVLQPTVRVVGASAAVYAVLTAHIPNVCLKYGSIPLWWFRPLSVVVLVATEITYELITSFAATQSSEQEPIAWSAHVLGAALGIPLGFVLFKGDDVNNSKLYIRTCRLASFVILVSAMAAIIMYYALTSDSTT